jgi:predicted anti-sigma-YlaC factor YlaD
VVRLEEEVPLELVLVLLALALHLEVAALEVHLLEAVVVPSVLEGAEAVLALLLL